MTLAACGVNYYPVRIGGSELSSGLGLTRTNLTFDSTSDRLAWVGDSNFAGTIAKVYFRTGTVTTGTTVQIQIETVTNGRPSGTIFSAGASGTVAIADTDDGVWKTVTIGTPPTLAAGNQFAIVMTYSSGATPNLIITSMPGNETGNGSVYPLCLQDTGGGTWAHQNSGMEWIVELGSGDIACLPCLSSSEANGTFTAFNSSSSPNEYALKLTLPFKCRIIGLSALIGNVATGADFTMSLWPSSSSVDGDALGQATVDGDSAVSTTADGYYTRHFTAVTGAAGSTYYLGIRADTANNLALASLVAPTGITNAVRAFPTQTITAHLATRAWSGGTAGSWTETATTTLPLISLVIDQLDDGAGGGTTIAGTPMLRGMI